MLKAMSASALLIGCDLGEEDGTTTGSTSAGSESGGSESGGTEGCEAATEWATGGTASMTATDCYPDPFVGGVTACMMVCQTTEGPCTSDTIDRQDVSEGLTGLPIRLSLKFVDAETCEPVEGAVVDIWHTQRSGVYSGVTPTGAFCYGDDPDAENYLYFRGAQTTDADGRVDFDTCYPGWYSSRAIHIHFRVVIDGSSYLVSQLFFDDALNEELCTTHPEYLDRGLPDTTNETDNIIGGEEDKSPYILDVARMADGVMLASKVVAIRSSLDEEVCNAEGAGGGPGGPGGPPPGEPPPGEPPTDM